MIDRSFRPTGDLQANLIRAPRAPVSWRLRNTLRWSYIKGYIATYFVAPFANWWGVMTVVSELHVRVRRLTDAAHIAQYQRLRAASDGSDAWRARLERFLEAHGTWMNYGVVSRRIITNAGVAFLVDDWDNDATDITNLHFHGLGTGTNAEAAGDTALQTESTTALNPDNTRATGTESQPAANQLRTVGTLTFDADAAITEHGIFSQAATGGGTLWDRSVFAAINVVGANGDSIQTTYTCTVSAGG